MSHTDITAPCRRSKRNRISAFDVSRVSLQLPPKVRKFKGNRMSNPGQAIPPMVTDMSGTIINTSDNLNVLPGTSGNATRNISVPMPSRGVDPLAAIVNESINETGLNLRPLVQEIISEEMKKVNDSIQQLTNIVAAVAGGVNNIPNNGENMANTSSATPLPSYGYDPSRENLARNVPTPESWHTI